MGSRKRMDDKVFIKYHHTSLMRPLPSWLHADSIILLLQQCFGDYILKFFHVSLFVPSLGSILRPCLPRGGFRDRLDGYRTVIVAEEIYSFLLTKGLRQLHVFECG